MGVRTSQQITNFYNNFKDVDVTFTKDVIKAMGLISKMVYLKLAGYQIPCVLYSVSMIGAKLIMNTKSGILKIFQKTNNTTSLRLAFIDRDKSDPLSFFVSAKYIGSTPYSNENPDLSFINLSFTQRPADDLIEKLGKLLEATAASKNRREERIIMTSEATRALKINPAGTAISIQNIPRKCILRDVSFSGAKVIIMGVAKFLLNKTAQIKIEFIDPEEAVLIEGTVVRHEAVEGRTDIAAYALQFTENKIPAKYKLRLSEFFKSQKKRVN